MHFKIVAVLVVSAVLVLTGIVALVDGNFLAALSCGWSGIVGFILTFNYCAGVRNKEIDLHATKYERYRRSTNQAA